MSHPPPFELSVAEACHLLESRPTGLRLIDVRDPEEFGVCRLEGAELIPLVTLPHEAVKKLTDRDAPIVVYCHHGMRSLRAVEMLRHLGYTRAQSVAGGIEKWSVEVDAKIPRY